MKVTFLLIATFFICAVSLDAQTLDAQQKGSFHISSLGTAYGVQADFQGQYEVYDDEIKLTFTKADVLVSDHCPYKGRRLLLSFEFGLATETQRGGWQIISSSGELPLEDVMMPKDVHSFRIGEIRLTKAQGTELSKRWLMLQIEEKTLNDAGDENQSGYSFAHSCRDVFWQ